MQLVRIKRRLREISDLGVTLSAEEYDRLVRSAQDALEAAEKVGVGHSAIAEVLNRL